MSSWVGALGLYLIQQLVLFCAVIQALSKNWLSPLQTASQPASPPPPRCVAVVLVDPVDTHKDLKHLALVLSW